MNYRWVLQCLFLFLPIILLSAYYISISYEKTGLPFSNFDVGNTHYKHYDTGYAPFLFYINQFMHNFGKNIYDMYFISLVFSVCFTIPFVLIHHISKNLEMPTLFLYATAIGTNHFVVGLIPQAILAVFILLVIVERRLTLPLFLLAWSVHSFGGFFVLIGYLFAQYSGFYDRQNNLIS